MMIKRIQSFEEYEDFIHRLSHHPLYSDPHFTHNKNNLYNAVKKNDEYAFAVLDHDRIEGLFVWLILPGEQFIEMLIGFTENTAAFSEMLLYMEKNYPGFQMDFVFNPRNPVIRRQLEMKGAKFETEQQKMQQKKALPDISTECIELLSERWEDQYCRLHRKETYWTAERILTAQDRFRVLLAIRDGSVQGYLDVTRCHAENEIYDLFVKPEASRQGYGLAMLVKAVELNKPHQMMVLVDVDAEEEIQLYTEAGFEILEGYNSVLASYRTR